MLGPTTFCGNAPAGQDNVFRRRVVKRNHRMCVWVLGTQTHCGGLPGTEYGRIGGHRRHESKRAQHSQSRTFCSFHTTISHDSRPTQAGSSFGLSGTFHDANETPAFGLSFVVNCSPLRLQSDASPAERQLRAPFCQCALPLKPLSYNSCSFTVIVSFGAHRAPLQRQSTSALPGRPFSKRGSGSQPLPLC